MLPYQNDNKNQIQMPNSRKEMENIWELVASYRPMDRDGLINSIANHLEFSQCKNRHTAVDFDIYRSLSLSIRDRLVEFSVKQEKRQSGELAMILKNFRNWNMTQV